MIIPNNLALRLAQALSDHLVMQLDHRRAFELTEELGALMVEHENLKWSPERRMRQSRHMMEVHRKKREERSKQA